MLTEKTKIKNLFGDNGWEMYDDGFFNDNIWIHENVMAVIKGSSLKPDVTFYERIPYHPTEVELATQKFLKRIYELLEELHYHDL